MCVRWYIAERRKSLGSLKPHKSTCGRYPSEMSLAIPSSRPQESLQSKAGKRIRVNGAIHIEDNENRQNVHNVRQNSSASVKSSRKIANYDYITGQELRTVYFDPKNCLEKVTISLFTSLNYFAPSDKSRSTHDVQLYVTFDVSHASHL